MKKLQTLRFFLEGKKTYLVSAALIAYGVLGVVSGQMDAQTAFFIVANGLGFGTLRAGIAKAI